MMMMIDDDTLCLLGERQSEQKKQNIIVNEKDTIVPPLERTNQSSWRHVSLKSVGTTSTTIGGSTPADAKKEHGEFLKNDGLRIPKFEIRANACVI